MPDDFEPLVPEIPREEHTPGPPRPKPPVDLGKPVPVPPFKGGDKVSLAEKIVLPARSSLIWDGIRHFLFGVIQGGGGALAALVAAGMMSSPAAWPIVGACAAGFGVVEAGRKIAKTKSGGRDWTDVLYQILELILKFFTMRKEGK